MTGVNIFSSTIKEHSKMTKPPYYYQDVIEYTDNNIEQIISEICEHIKKEFIVDESKLKNFLITLTEEKNKAEFNDFIIGGYKTKNKIYLAIKTNINLNFVKRDGIN